MSYATSPVIDCSGYDNVAINFRRHAYFENASDYDRATVEVYNGSTWQVVFDSDDTAANINDESWTLQNPGISTYGDLNADFQIRFGLDSDTGTSYRGWFIDAVEVTGDAATNYQIEGKTYDKDGSPLSTCKCLLLKDNLNDTCSVVDYTTSNVSGEYSFTGIADNNAQYQIYAWKDNTPHVFDATDHDLLPKEIPDISYDLYLRSDTDKGESSPDKDLRLRSDADKVVSTEPTVTNFGDEYHYPQESGIIITGTNFEAAQVSGTAKLGDASTFAGSTKFTTLTVTNWTATAITVTIPLSLGDNSEGTLYVYVTNDTEETNATGYSCTVKSIWGLPFVQVSNAGCNYWRMMGGTSPNLDSMILKKVQVYVGPTHGSQIRIGVYTGGALDDPEGATLLEDLGQTTGSGTSEWIEMTSSTEPSIPKNTPLWLSYKGSTGSGTFDINYYGTTAVPCDFQQGRGRCEVVSGSHDPSVAYASTVPAIVSFGDYWYTIYLEFEISTGTRTVTFHCGANGTLTGADTTQSVSNGGDSTTITALADSTYVFNGWTGDHVSLVNPLQITNVTSDKDVTSNFGLWGINNPNYITRKTEKQCLFCGTSVPNYQPVICDCSSVPYPMLGGVRESIYGTATEDITHTDWTNSMWAMHWYSGRGNKVGLFNISAIIGSNCRFNFEDPGGVSDEDITFTGTDTGSATFTKFSADGDIDIYLGIELGLADPAEAIQVALNKYGGQSCVKGILIDLEWWNVNGTGNYTTQLPKATAESWLSTIQAYDADYKLILRHPDPDILPPPDPDFDTDIWVNCDDQGFLGLDGTGDYMIPMMKTFVETFPTHTAILQIGYNDIWGDGGETRNDKDWWGSYDDPPAIISKAIIDNIASADQTTGIVWVDFSLQDEEIDFMLDTPDSTALWDNCELHRNSVVGLNLPANSPVCSLCDTSGKACW